MLGLGVGGARQHILGFLSFLPARGGKRRCISLPAQCCKGKRGGGSREGGACSVCGRSARACLLYNLCLGFPSVPLSPEAPAPQFPRSAGVCFRAPCHLRSQPKAAPGALRVRRSIQMRAARATQCRQRFGRRCFKPLVTISPRVLRQIQHQLCGRRDVVVHWLLQPLLTETRARACGILWGRVGPFLAGAHLYRAAPPAGCERGVSHVHYITIPCRARARACVRKRRWMPLARRQARGLRTRLNQLTQLQHRKLCG